MAYEQRDGSGALFKNDKEGNEKRPDYTGKIMLGGKLYYLSAWIKQSERGAFMSLNGELPRNQQEPTSVSALDDSDIPF